MSFDVMSTNSFKGLEGSFFSKPSNAKEVDVTSTSKSSQEAQSSSKSFNQVLSKQHKKNVEKSQSDRYQSESHQTEKAEGQNNQYANGKTSNSSKLNNNETQKNKANQSNTAGQSSQSIDKGSEFFAPSVAQNAYGSAEKSDIHSIEEVSSSDILSLSDDSEEYKVLNPDQDAMIRFLNSMQKELNVSPEQMIEAFDRLSAEDLLSAPEESFDKVISNLNLTGAKANRAEELYHNMLKETAEESFRQSVQEHGEILNLKVEGPEERRQREVIASIERMNRDFFPDQVARRQLANSKATANSAYAQQSSPEGLASPFFVENMSASQVNPGTPTAASYMGADSGIMPMRTAGVDHTQSYTGTEVEGFNIENPFQLNSINSSSAESGGKDLFSSSQSSEIAANLYADNEEAKTNEFGEQLNTYSSVSNSQDLKINPEDMFIQNGSEHLAVGKQDEAANIRNIIQNSQTLIERGGGQMKVQLRPEGLGQVDLHVTVKEGKVDVQMLTDNQETKRLLEGGFENLKSGLAQHKLNVDSFKVDVSQRADSQLDQNFNHANRENAREFLGQFREFNQNQRHSFFETTPLRGYGSTKAKNLRPEAVSSSSKSKDANRRLNLVA